MPADVAVKICGLSTPETMAAAVSAQARYVGLVFFQKSPRFVDVPRARQLALAVPFGVCKVGLFVDPTDADLSAVMDHVPLDMVQLHGQESRERISQIRENFGLPVMKAFGIATADDLEKIAHYGSVADQLLVDAKPPPGGDVPGGNGLPFDWRLIENRRWPVPWMLSGGLTADNVAQAVRLTGANQIDLSSGVESARGVKDVGMIQTFMDAALG